MASWLAAMTTLSGIWIRSRIYYSGGKKCRKRVTHDCGNGGSRGIGGRYAWRWQNRRQGFILTFIRRILWPLIPKNRLPRWGAKPKCLVSMWLRKGSFRIFWAALCDETGRIDVLVNNAGITRDQAFGPDEGSDWDAVLNVNLKGALHCNRMPAKQMMKTTLRLHHHIASHRRRQSATPEANYVASKAGIIGLTKTAPKSWPRGNYGQCGCPPVYSNRHDGKPCRRT